MSLFLFHKLLFFHRPVVDANVIDQAGEEDAGANYKQPMYWRIAGRAGKINSEDTYRIFWICPLSLVQ